MNNSKSLLKKLSHTDGRDHPDLSPDWTGVPYNPSGTCDFVSLDDPQHNAADWKDVGAVVDLPPHSATLGMDWYPASPPTQTRSTESARLVSR